MTVLVPISWGELLDKITILEIKSERLAPRPVLPMSAMSCRPCARSRQESQTTKEGSLP